MTGGVRSPKRFPRWMVGAAVVVAASAGIYFDVRHAPPVYPSARALRAQGIVTAPLPTRVAHLSPEEALSSAETDGLAGGSMAVRLVHLSGFGYHGRAWEVSATHAQYQPLSGPAIAGAWVVLFFNPNDGRLIGYVSVP